MLTTSIVFIQKCHGKRFHGWRALITEACGHSLRRLEWQFQKYLGWEEVEFLRCYMEVVQMRQM
jgi:hypothetical protein